MCTLQVFSIFRDSAEYVDTYLRQLCLLFEYYGNNCRAVWLEGDSMDNTYEKLQKAKIDFEFKGNEIELVKFEVGGHKWPSMAHPDRWLQISTCWNKCLEHGKPSKYTMAVESDLLWNYDIVPRLLNYLGEKVHVIYPMLMTYRSIEYVPFEQFYDIHGFSINGNKFQGQPPYWPVSEEETDELLKISTGGGMILSTFDNHTQGRFGDTDCIMKFPREVNLYMHKEYRCYHPHPKEVVLPQYH